MGGPGGRLNGEKGRGRREEVHVQYIIHVHYIIGCRPCLPAPSFKVWGIPRLIFFFQLINLEKQGQGSISKGTVHGVPLHMDLGRLLA